jgi:hypothetical protein
MDARGRGSAQSEKPGLFRSSSSRCEGTALLWSGSERVAQWRISLSEVQKAAREKGRIAPFQTDHVIVIASFLRPTPFPSLVSKRRLV